MQEKYFPVLGMSCQGCVRSVRCAISGLAGVARVDVSLDKACAWVEFDSDRVSVDAIRAAILEAGFDSGAEPV